MPDFRELNLAIKPPPPRHVLAQVLMMDLKQWFRDHGHDVDTPGAFFIRKLVVVEDGRLYVTFSEGPPDA